MVVAKHVLNRDGKLTRLLIITKSTKTYVHVLLQPVQPTRLSMSIIHVIHVQITKYPTLVSEPAKSHLVELERSSLLMVHVVRVEITK